jgi:beta-N-acetylhexosaminidase
MADELRACGVNANCAPMLDVVQPGAHEFLQKRALGRLADQVTVLGQAIALGLRDGGVAPVIKHAPGHGRGDADSHLALPRVKESLATLEAADFPPFRALRKEAMLMTAHVLFDALDKDHPATLSRRIVEGLIRRDWGYDGLIMTDDINMNALGGGLTERSRAALDAGCEMICHCNGERADMEAVALAARPLSDDTRRRGDRARAIGRQAAKEFDREAAADRLRRLGLYEEPGA